MPAQRPVSSTRLPIGWFLFYSALLTVYSLASSYSAQAADAQCAEITFSLSQQASFERQAFDARLTLHNASPLPLTDIDVELQFLDAQLHPVPAALDTDATSANFFYRLLTPHSGLSTITAEQAETLHWQIIPARGAAVRFDTRYYLAAKVSYTQGERREVFDIKPVAIRVKPLPELIVDYFLPIEVYGDDPFTPEIETPIPFTLGVRVINSGFSPSIATTIESAQPVIRENKQHLLTQWKLLSTQVGAHSAERRMQLNLGNIAPGASRVGRWVMTSALSGKFIDFRAAIRHGDTLGGELTSLIKQTRQWPLLHDVLDSRSGRDSILDFLVFDANQLRLFSSEGDDSAVSDISVETTVSRHDSSLSLSAVESPHSRYLKIDDPWKGKKPLLAVYRGDGSILPTANAWLSKTRNEQLQWHHSINVFLPPGGEETIIAEFAAPQPENSGQIAGRVFYDKNANGLIDKSEHGVSKIPVILTGIDSQGQQWLYTQKADTLGRFSFNKLVAGSWTLTVGHLSGFIDGKSSPGSSSGHALPGQIRDIAVSPGTKITQLLFAKQNTVPADIGQADLEVHWAFPPVMAQSHQPWSLMLIVDNPSSQSAKGVRVQMPWPTRNISQRESRSWSIQQGELTRHPSRWKKGEWIIGDMAANSRRVLAIDGVTRRNSRPQRVDFLAQLGSETPDDNLDNNVAQQLLVIREYQKNSAINFDFSQWIDNQLAEWTVANASQPH